MANKRSKTPPRRGKETPAKNPRVKKARTANIAKSALGMEPPKRGLQAKPKSDMSERAKRELAVTVKTAKGRKISSTLWLQRQLNDPYVLRAREEGYRSRAAYKIIELDEKFNFFKKGQRVCDLGAAPGGWCQYAVKQTNALDPDPNKAGIVVGIDYLGMPHIDGAQLLEMDFLDEDAPRALKDLLGGRADIVMSDMAAPTTGHKATDHLKIIALVETALGFAEEVLLPGGAFIAKVFQGGTENDLLNRLKTNFTKVAHAKPKASRQDSSESYVVAMGFKGGKSPTIEEMNLAKEAKLAAKLANEKAKTEQDS